jgi:hypothetical protein
MIGDKELLEIVLGNTLEDPALHALGRLSRSKEVTDALLDELPLLGVRGEVHRSGREHERPRGFGTRIAHEIGKEELGELREPRAHAAPPSPPR